MHPNLTKDFSPLHSNKSNEWQVSDQRKCGGEPLKFGISNKLIRVKFPDKEILNEADFGSISPSQELHNTNT